MGTEGKLGSFAGKVNRKIRSLLNNEDDLIQRIDPIRKCESSFVILNESEENADEGKVSILLTGRSDELVIGEGLEAYIKKADFVIGNAEVVGKNKYQNRKHGISVAFILCKGEEQAENDIKKAKAEGTEFVIVYCPWEDIEEKSVLKEQEAVAKVIANAGADYILGVKTDCIQPYSIIETEDGRIVPVFYSVGCFMVSKENTATMMLELELEKKGENVLIQSEKIHPCIVEKGKMELINHRLKVCNLEEKISLESEILRIGTSAGNLGRLTMAIAEEENPLINLKAVEAESKYQQYEVGKVKVAKQTQTCTTETKNEYVFDENEEIYKRSEDHGVREAKIICTGQLGYDSVFEKNAECFGKYEFSKGFKTISKCFNEADFVVGSLASMVSESYPSVSRFQSQTETRAYYCNARTEYVDTLKDAGFSCLAMANPYNVCTGVDGIFETESLLKQHNMIVSGIGFQKNPVVEINGIKVAVLSYVVECLNKNNIISSDGAKKLLNEYEASEFAKHVEQVKQKGAEFILVNLNCGTGKSNSEFKLRKYLSEEIAELGGDYVVCSIPAVLSPYYKYHTSDGRCVPIATSLGSFIYGVNNPKGEQTGALLKIILRKNFEGKLEVADNYIPLKLFREYKGAQSVVVPLHSYFNAEYIAEEFKEDEKEIAEKIGKEIPLNREKSVSLRDCYRENLTIAEVYQILNKRPSAGDMIRLGKNYNARTSCIASRSTALMEGCVAVLNNDAYYPITIEQAVEKGAVLVISKKRYRQLPCIVPEGSVYGAYKKLIMVIREKYNPITVAITGSVGKTTTKELMCKVFDTYYKTSYVDGNHNTFKAITEVVQKLQETDEAYIQEVSGGYVDLPKNCSKLLKPDICMITSIGPAHLENLGTVENVLKNKAQITAGMKKRGVLVINDDNEYLHGYKRKGKTIRYSNHNPACDYYAQNMVIEEDQITFQIVSKGGKYDEPGVYDAKIYIQGEHNVTNAVGVFAAARQAGIPPHKIIAGLSSFRPKGDRQNLIEAGGCKFLIDAYNSNPVSLLSAVKALETISVNEGNKRILVLGDMYEQGEDSESIHYNTGQEISKCEFDVLLCSGEESYYFVKAAREANKTAYFMKDKDCFNQIISELIAPGDVILFKASGGVRMKAETIQPILGDIQ